MFKNIDEQLAGHNAIHLDSRPLIVTKGFLLFDHNQRARLCLSHLKARLDDFIDCLLREELLLSLAGIRKDAGRQEILFSQLFQCMTQLRLHDDDDCHHREAQKILCKPENRCHVHDKSQQQKNTDHGKPL